MDKLRGRTKGATASQTGLTRALKRTGGAIAVLNGPLGGISGRFTLLAQLIGQTGLAVAGLVLAISGLSLAMLAVARIAGGFDKQMQAVLAITSATREEFAALTDTARKLGATTIFTAREAASGMEFLARAGFNAAETIAAIPAVLDLAIVGALGLAEAADIVSNIMTAFGIDVSRTSDAVDVLAFTAARSNTNVEELGQAMKFAAPIARNLNISLNETAAAMAILAGEAIKASLAGTGFRQTVLRLIDATPKSIKALDKLGLSFADVNPAANDLAKVFKNLQKAGFGVEEAIDIFGVRTAGVALILTKGADELEEFTERTKELSGFASEAATIMGDNLVDALKALRSAAEELILAFGEAGATGALRSIIDVSTDVLRILSGMDDVLITDGIAANLLAGAIRLLAIAFASLLFVKLIAGFTKLAVAVLTYRTAALAAAAATRAFTAALARNPIGIVVVAVTALAAAMLELGETTEDVVEKRRDFLDIERELANLRRGRGADDIVSQANRRSELNLLIEQQVALTTNLQRVERELVRARAAVEAEGSPAALVTQAKFELASLVRQSGKLIDALSNVSVQIEVMKRGISGAALGMTDLATEAKRLLSIIENAFGTGAVFEKFRDDLESLKGELIPGEKIKQELDEALFTLNFLLEKDEEVLKLLKTTKEELRDLIALAKQRAAEETPSLQKIIDLINERTIAARLGTDVSKLEIAVTREVNRAKNDGLLLDLKDIELIREKLKVLLAVQKANKDQDAADKRQESAQRSFRKQFAETLLDLKEQGLLLGKSEKEARKLAANFDLIKKAAVAGIPLEELEAMQVELNKSIDVLEEMERLSREGGFMDGVNDAFREMAESAKTFREVIKEATLATFDELEDRILEFAQTGRLNIDEMFESIRLSLIKLGLELAKVEIAGILGDLFGFGGESKETGAAQTQLAAANTFQGAVSQFSIAVGNMATAGFIPGSPGGILGGSPSTAGEPGFPGAAGPAGVKEVETVFSGFISSLSTTFDSVLSGFSETFSGFTSGLGSLFSSLFGSGSGTAGSGGSGGVAGGLIQAAIVAFARRGGIVGSMSGESREVAMSAFAGARRFQRGGGVRSMRDVAGLRPGEVPIVAHEGEVVIPADQSRNLRRVGLLTRDGRLRLRGFQEGGFIPRPSGSTRGPPGPDRSSGRAQTPINLRVNVQAEDLDSFNRSEGEIGRRMGTIVSRHLRRNG